MATYGLNGTGQIPFTGWTNVLGNVSTGGQPSAPASTGAVAFNGITQTDAALARIFRKGGQSKGVKAIWYALTLSGVGSTATASYKRIQARQAFNTDMGGAQPIETVSVMNRSVTTADITAFTSLMNRLVSPASYPADLSNNGGGGKGAW